MDDNDDTASNPLADEHLPVGGEVGDEDDTAPDISDDFPGEDDEDDLVDETEPTDEELRETDEEDDDAGTGVGGLS